MISSYKLPFFCDDVFNIEEADRYEGTFSCFTWWSIEDDEDEIKKNVDESINVEDDKDLDIYGTVEEEEEIAALAIDKMKVFVVCLVAQEKVKEKVVKPAAKTQALNKVVKRRSRRSV